MYSCDKDVSPEEGQRMTETCRLKLETIKVIHTFKSAFVGITYMNEIRINAWYGTQSLGHCIHTFTTLKQGTMHSLHTAPATTSAGAGMTLLV
jgi:hypothetical protein